MEGIPWLWHLCMFFFHQKQTNTSVVEWYLCVVVRTLGDWQYYTLMVMVVGVPRNEWLY